MAKQKVIEIFLFSKMHVNINKITMGFCRDNFNLKLTLV